MNLPAKRTKIVATIGPGSESPETLEALMNAGMNVARINMSHGNHDEYRAQIAAIRNTAQKLALPVAILQDLSGPKIRTGEYTTERITIEAGKEIILTTEEVAGTAERIFVNYAALPKEVREGSVIMLDDGKKKLVVERVSDSDVHCRVVVGGELKPRRGVNLPGANLSISSVTEKDERDLAFGLAEGVDLIALSFVRRFEDVQTLKELLKKAGKTTPVIAKIETQESIENLSAILAVADGVMVARGDLAIEVPTEQVPLLQKQIVREATTLGKPVIIATQMLESMVHSPVPTRAEVSDVANAIFDGADAVMLSEESALGEYPVEAVRMMARIAETVEASLPRPPSASASIVDTVSQSVVQTAGRISASVIVALTESGSTARMVARAKPSCPIVAFTPHEETVKQLALVRGVCPFRADAGRTIDDVVTFVSCFLLENAFAKRGDRVVVAAGLNFGVGGSTNLLFVLTL